MKTFLLVMRRIVVILFMTGLFVSTFAAQAVPMAELPFFPIVGFNFLWLPDEEMIREQAEMGLTLVTVYGDKELDWCGKYGLKAIVYRHHAINRYLHDADPEKLESDIADMVNAFKSHKAFYTLQFTDEPGKSVYDGYAKTFEAIKKAAPQTPVYTNFYPSWSLPIQHGYADYEEYVETFCQLFAKYPNQPFIYDNYRNKDTRLNPVERIASFLENLDTVARITGKHGISFWITVLGAQHDHFREPTAADLDFQVFSSLAYGAKGIGYFTTCSHQNLNFQGGPFNYLGDKTPTFYNMRELNYRVRMLAPVLNKLTFQGAYYSLTAEDEVDFNKFPMHKRLPGKQIESIKSDRGNCSFLVGELKDDQGDDWVIVVNLNMEEVAYFTATLLNEGKQLQHFNSYVGKLFPKNHVDPWLRPGQGKLYKVVEQ